MASDFQLVKREFALKDLVNIPNHLLPEIELSSATRDINMEIYGIVWPNPFCNDEKAKKELASYVVDELSNDLKKTHFVWVGLVKSKLEEKKKVAQFNNQLKLIESAHALDVGTQHIACSGNLSTQCIEKKESLACAMYTRGIYVINDIAFNIEKVLPHISDTKYETSEIDVLSYLNSNPTAKIGHFFGSPDFGGVYLRLLSFN